MVFAKVKRPAVDWTAFVETLARVEKCSASGARKKMEAMVALGLVHKDSSTGLYTANGAPKTR